jgi:hypothetical protein
VVEEMYREGGGGYGGYTSTCPVANYEAIGYRYPSSTPATGTGDNFYYNSLILKLYYSLSVFVTIV